MISTNPLNRSVFGSPTMAICHGEHRRLNRELNGQIRRFALDSRSPRRDLASMPNLSRLFVGGGPRDPRSQLSGGHLPRAGQHDDRLPARASTASWPTAFTGATNAAWKCGPPGTTASRDRKSGTSSTTATAPSPPPSGSPSIAKAAAPTIICTPAPVHNADGSESPWCFTRPESLYDEAESQARPLPAATFLGTARRHSSRPPGSSTRRS